MSKQHSDGQRVIEPLIVRVLESRRWRHTTTGQTASIYGACPWTSQSDKPYWLLETVGWTWEHKNGTVGLGRKPTTTREEALAVMVEINSEHSNRVLKSLVSFV